MKQNNILVTGILLATTLFTFLGCQDDDNGIVKRNWQLVWEDDFDGIAGESPDSAKWTYDIGTGANGWGNSELQYYTDRPENISMDGEGNLAITARSESFGGSSFTSARIKTQNLFEQAYGRFEARLKMPWGPGIWPAFWMLGAISMKYHGHNAAKLTSWSYRGQQPNLINGTLHGPGYSGGSCHYQKFWFHQQPFRCGFPPVCC
jgi:beta-glucanase (GH16 family)